MDIHKHLTNPSNHNQISFLSKNWSRIGREAIPIPWPPLIWFLASTGHQQPWEWPCTIIESLYTMVSISVTDIIEDWDKKIKIMFPWLFQHDTAWPSYNLHTHTMTKSQFDRDIAQSVLKVMKDTRYLGPGRRSMRRRRKVSVYPRFY